jgi:hypothetical protein
MLAAILNAGEATLAEGKLNPDEAIQLALLVNELNQVIKNLEV